MGVGICIICSKGTLRVLDNFNAVSDDICKGFTVNSPNLLLNISVPSVTHLFNPLNLCNAYKWDVDQIYLHSAKEVVRAVENDTKSIAKITI